MGFPKGSNVAHQISFSRALWEVRSVFLMYDCAEQRGCSLIPPLRLLASKQSFSRGLSSLALICLAVLAFLALCPVTIISQAPFPHHSHTAPRSHCGHVRACTHTHTTSPLPCMCSHIHQSVCISKVTCTSPPYHTITLLIVRSFLYPLSDCLLSAFVPRSSLV